MNLTPYPNPFLHRIRFAHCSHPPPNLNLPGLRPREQGPRGHPGAPQGQERPVPPRYRRAGKGGLLLPRGAGDGIVSGRFNCT